MKEKLIEVARSYSQKLNTGNYTSADFFCSQKLEVPESEAEEASNKAFQWCYEQVQRDISMLTEAASNPGKTSIIKAATKKVSIADSLGIKPKKKASECPDCGKWNKADATVCATCHSSGTGDRTNQREVGSDRPEGIGNDGSTN